LAVLIAASAALAGLCGKWLGPIARVHVAVFCSALLATLGGAWIAGEGVGLRAHVVRWQSVWAASLGYMLGIFVGTTLSAGYGLAVVTAGALAGALSAKPRPPTSEHAHDA
jgi:hypothetical protein